MASCADCNVFQFCQFLKLLGKVMILLVLLIVGLTYYSVIAATAIPALYEGTAGSKFGNVLVIITFHVLVSIDPSCGIFWALPQGPKAQQSAVCPGCDVVVELLHSSHY